MTQYYQTNLPDKKINKNLYLINKYISNKNVLNKDSNKQFFKKYSICGLW